MEVNSTKKPDYKDLDWTILAEERKIKWERMLTDLKERGYKSVQLRTENEFTSELIILPIHEKKRGMLIVCAGGGFMFKSVNEALPVAEFFHNNGMNTAILDYHVDIENSSSMEVRISAGEDGLAAVRYLRANADELGILSDKIAIGGFSAGGILSAIAATKFDYGDSSAADPVLRVSSRPDAVLILYGAISSSGIQGQNGLFSFSYAVQAERAKTDPLRNIHPDCPPMFIFQTHADDPRHALTFCYELACNGVPYEIHTFEEGPHGGALYDGKCDDSPYFGHTSRWATLAAEWLENKGF